MKIKYTNSNSRIVAEMEGETQIDLFEQISSFQEIFDETCCGKCESERLRFVSRNVADNLYYEVRCLDCGSRLSFGKTKTGGRLFPKRKDKEGNWLQNRGWVKWNPETKQEE
tara:strand:+ start:43 stop:378 length:336 start_codon:yes stop_codon:yes gene_type:complete